MSGGIDRYLREQHLHGLRVFHAQIKNPVYEQEIRTGEDSNQLFSAAIKLITEDCQMPATEIVRCLLDRKDITASQIDNWGHSSKSEDLPNAETRMAVIRAIDRLLDERLEDVGPSRPGNGGGTPPALPQRHLH